MLERDPYLKIRTAAKFDGSIWRQYESPSYLFVITSLGRQLLREHRTFGDFTRYNNDYINERDDPTAFRSYLAEGRSGQVFTLGNDLVVKEAKPFGDSLFGALNRMDQLIDALQKNCPSWIDVPAHYGLAISKTDTSKQFMLMQKIDHGVTVGDIMSTRESYSTRTNLGSLSASALDKFGPITPELQEEVKERYESLKYLAKRAVLKEGLNPDVYLPDIDYPYNVVIEKLATPIAGSRIKYSIIDQ